METYRNHMFHAEKKRENLKLGPPAPSSCVSLPVASRVAPPDASRGPQFRPNTSPKPPCAYGKETLYNRVYGACAADSGRNDRLQGSSRGGRGTARENADSPSAYLSFLKNMKAVSPNSKTNEHAEKP
jgi:hypothetical protein